MNTLMSISIPTEDARALLEKPPAELNEYMKDQKYDDMKQLYAQLAVCQSSFRTLKETSQGKEERKKLIDQASECVEGLGITLSQPFTSLLDTGADVEEVADSENASQGETTKQPKQRHVFGKSKGKGKGRRSAKALSDLRALCDLK